MRKSKIKNTAKIIIIIIIIVVYINIIYYSYIYLRLAICTMARKENLYIKEYVDYYLKLGFDHIFIFDDNPFGGEKISTIINKSYSEKVTIYDYRKTINNQKVAYTLCYEINKYEYDWIFMNDIDEYLVINNDSLKHYLSDNKFKKCDFIKFHWVVSRDNNLLHYDNRTLLKRFKGPYINDTHIKTMVKGKIKGLQFDIHTPSVSPYRNVSCNNKGEIYKNKEIFFQDVFDINIENAYIIHFIYKSTEEFIDKYKRGYRDWFGKGFLPMRIREYFRDNKITLEKVEYLEKELSLNLTKIKNKLNKNK